LADAYAGIFPIYYSLFVVQALIRV